MPIANVAIPTLFPHWIVAFIVVLPVIGIEACIARCQLSLTFATAFRVCSRANIISTLAGIPLAWCLSLLVLVPIGFVSGLSSSRPSQALGRFGFSIFFFGGMASEPPAEALFLAQMILLVPYYYVSVLLERKSLERSLPGVNRNLVFSTSIAMNRTSYALLFAIFWVLFLLFR